MDDVKLLGVIKNFVGKKVTFKEISNALGIELNILIDEIMRLEEEQKLSYLPLGDGKIRIGKIEGAELIEKTTLKKPKQTTRMIKISCTNWSDCAGATEKSKKNHEGLILRISSNALQNIIKLNKDLKCPVCLSLLKFDKNSLPLDKQGETIMYKKRID